MRLPALCSVTKISGFKSKPSNFTSTVWRRTPVRHKAQLSTAKRAEAHQTGIVIRAMEFRSRVKGSALPYVQTFDLPHNRYLVTNIWPRDALTSWFLSEDTCI